MSSEETDAPESRPESSQEPQEGMSWWREQFHTWAPAIFAVLFIRSFIFEPFHIPSGSMLPTLQIGDQVFVSKSSYGLWVPATGLSIPFLDSVYVIPRYELMDWGDPERGDIIVFRFPRNEKQNFIKRVVAVPGDTVSVRNNKIILNGVEQDMSFLERVGYRDRFCNERQARSYNETLNGTPHPVYTNASALGGVLSNHREITVPPEHVFVMGDNRDNSEDSRAWGFVRADQIKGKAHFVWLSLDNCADSLEPRGDRIFKSLYGALAQP